jgi:hypothetical protein
MMGALGGDAKSDSIVPFFKMDRGCGWVGDFADLKQSLSRNPVAAQAASRFERDIQQTLNRNFKNACFTEYLGYLKDSSRSETVRIPILKAMLGRHQMLDPAHKKTLGFEIRRMLGAAFVTSKMKQEILIRLKHFPDSGDAQVFISFFGSTDTSLRSAAYRGLGGKVRSNGNRGDSSANRAIFNALMVVDSTSGSLEQIRVIASIQEGYSRDHLMSKCAGNPSKIAEILKRDSGPGKDVVLMEALKLLGESPSNEPLKTALQLGSNDAWSNAQELLKGNNEEKEAGLRLLRLFPKVQSEHEDAVEALVNAGNAEVR